MRRVELKMDENKKYLVIKKLVENNGNKQRAALELGCTNRHINRMIKGYKRKRQGVFCSWKQRKKNSSYIRRSYKAECA